MQKSKLTNASLSRRKKNQHCVFRGIDTSHGRDDSDGARQVDVVEFGREALEGVSDFVGLFEYLAPASDKKNARPAATRAVDFSAAPATNPREKIAGLPRFDRTAKLYIGGKQARPDSGYSLPVFDASGRQIAEVGQGNRKDIRNAVEAAHKAESWARTTGHQRAQVLYYLAENLAARADEFGRRLAVSSEQGQSAEREVALSIERIYTYAAWADKYDGAVHHTASRNITLAMPEPIGVLGIICPDEWPLLGLVSTMLPAISMGNTIVAVPSQKTPLAATDLYQVLDTSDIPGGVVNIVTGMRDELAPVLAAHDDVDGIWYFGSAEGSAEVERLSADNMKRTWVDLGQSRDWGDPRLASGEEFLEQATQVKNIWVPYGE